MERDEQKKSVIPLVTIVIAIIFAIILVLIVATHFNSRTMMIDTGYKVSDIRWGEGWAYDTYNNEHRTPFRYFFHPADYGPSFCKFNVHVEDAVIPVYFSAFKCDWWDYDIYRLKISKGDSDSEILVQVYGDGYEYKRYEAATYNIYETDRIEIAFGP